ncbi:transcription antiterminator [Listeria floridensis FSL S10-1187]|uniref:Transcription antiterminator n=1 Tax=Listeria floridensis FSL S10-1187 TaxID=1265817 RepID=A0ABP3B359_9LIST|nr:PTS sugar transporter subunit IIA [Listeria floridensis]EUJ33737.1 transcription antiterminator [Listeria floridensis FSL S10-1187]
MFSPKKENVPETPLERVHFILYQLLIQEKEELHLTFFSERLFVSELTLKKDMKEAQNLLLSYDLKIVQHKNFYTITGNEKNKRSLMSQLLFEETQKRSFDVAAISELTAQLGISLETIQKLVLDEIDDSNVFINEISLNNIYLHLLVAIYRQRKKHTISMPFHEDKIAQTAEYRISENLARSLENEFEIQVSAAEVYYLALVFIGNNILMQSADLSLSELKSYIEPEYIELVRKIIRDVYNLYYIDFSDEEFLVRFIVHLKNLTIRTEYDHFTKNPLAPEIKHSYPLIYDISVFIASEIAAHTDAFIPEGEIAFIALHLGSYLESKTKQKKRLNAMLIAPNYQGIDYLLSKKITEQFGDRLLIRRVVQSLSSTEYLKENIDFVITTADLLIQPHSPVIKIHPFIKNEDYKKIEQTVSRLLKERQRTHLKSYLDWYFPKDLFFYNTGLTKQDELIHFLVERLVKKGYAEPNFEQQIWEREKLSSTAFGNRVAMPHTLKHSANKTRIAIIVEPKPINWDVSRVQFICLIATHEKDKQTFGPLFQAFISVLSDAENVAELVQMKTYDAFSETLLKLLDNEADMYLE